MKRVLLALVIGVLVAVPASATNRYVRAAAAGTGTGADWTNAYTTLGACETAAVRGDICYVAGGTYGENVTFNTAASGTTVITIKGASVSDHGTATGWIDNYSVATTQALWNGWWEFDTRYWTIDGIVGADNCQTLTCWTSGFGFKVHFGGGITVFCAGTYLFAHTCGDVTMSHIEIAGDGDDGVGGGNDGMQVFDPQGPVTLSHAYVHDVGRCIFFFLGRTNPFTVEYTYTGRHESTAGEHSETVVLHEGADFTLRYSIITHVEGTGGIICGDDSTTSCAPKIYGNVFYHPSTDTDWDLDGNGLFATDSSGHTGNARIYDNTFIDLPGPGKIFGSPGIQSGGLVANNYYYNNNAGLDNDAVGAGYATTQSFEHWQSSGVGVGTSKTTGTGNPFTSYTTGNFGLLAATTAGTTLASPFTTDMFGTTRGADGTWDRGAVEYCSGGCGGGGGGGGATTKTRIRFKRYAPGRQGDDDEGETHGVYRSLQAAPRGDAAGAHRRVRAHGWVLRVAAPVRPSEPAHDGRVGAGRGQDDRGPAEAGRRVGEVEGDTRASRRGPRKVACAARTARAYSAA